MRGGGGSLERREAVRRLLWLAQQLSSGSPRCGFEPIAALGADGAQLAVDDSGGHVDGRLIRLVEREEQGLVDGI